MPPSRDRRSQVAPSTAGQPAGPQPVNWRVVRTAEPAGEAHRRDPEPGTDHQLWVNRIPRPALILGSTQPDGLIRAERARADGLEVCRRRSGGGLVYLDPATDCWLDAIVPAGSPLWEDDVGLAFHWLGQRWASTLGELLDPVGPIDVVRPRSPTASTGRAGSPDRSPGQARGGARRSSPRSLWCFANLGHGEVTIGVSKVVGLSQRRTRHWIRLQSLVLGAWPGPRLLPYLDLDHYRAGTDGPDLPPEADPAGVRAGPPPGVRLPTPDALIEAFLDHTDQAGDGRRER